MKKILGMKNKISLEEAAFQLSKKVNQKFTLLMQHGTMSVEYYAPEKVDQQMPHVQDEIYVIASGSGSFTRDEEQMDFKTGDILFVPAGMEHRFINFTEDFATWVIFYGPNGGEK